MSNVYLIALTDDADAVDLVDVLRGYYGVEIIERGYEGRYVTASMHKEVSDRIRNDLSFVTLEPASEMSLL